MIEIFSNRPKADIELIHLIIDFHMKPHSVIALFILLGPITIYLLSFGAGSALGCDFSKAWIASDCYFLGSNIGSVLTDLFYLGAFGTMLSVVLAIPTIIVWRIIDRKKSNGNTKQN